MRAVCQKKKKKSTKKVDKKIERLQMYSSEINAEIVQ